MNIWYMILINLMKIILVYRCLKEKEKGKEKREINLKIALLLGN